MGNFYTDVISKDPRFYSVNRCSDLALLEPVTRDAVQAIMSAASKLGLPVMAFETFRSDDRQMSLFNNGATQLKTSGVHHYGLACDIVRLIDGEPSWKCDYTFLGPLARANGLISGLDWGASGVMHKFVDADHVQRCTVADQQKLFSGEWYPDGTYSPYPNS